MPEPAIVTGGLGKDYGRTVALDDFDLEIPAGSVVGLVGPNGSGKTTALRLLLGLTPPSRGQARVLGLDPARQSLALRRRVGYVPERHHIYPWMKVRQVLALAAAYYPTWRAANCERLLEQLRLPENSKVEQLSRGDVAKLALVVALAHEPELLLLDEPTSGLDPQIRRDFLELIRDLIAEGGTTVLLSTHILSDVERVGADRVAVIRQGRCISCETTDTIVARFRRASLIFDQQPGEETELPGAIRLQRGIREWVAMFEGIDEDEILRLARAAGARDCQVAPVSFEDAFVALMDRYDEEAGCESC